MTARHQTYISQTKIYATKLWEGLIGLKSMQAEWNAQDYGNTLANGEGSNLGVNHAEAGAAIFATANAIETLMAQGHATNITKLL